MTNTDSYKDEAGNSWTMEDLLADLDRGDYLYLTPKMCADVAEHIRRSGPVVPASLQDALNSAKWACESYVNWYGKGMAHEAPGIAYELVSVLRLLMDETTKALPSPTATRSEP